MFIEYEHIRRNKENAHSVLTGIVPEYVPSVLTKHSPDKDSVQGVIEDVIEDVKREFWQEVNRFLVIDTVDYTLLTGD